MKKFTRVCNAATFFVSVLPILAVAQAPQGPLSMVTERRSEQTLSNGIRIRTVTTQKVYRDGEGRTRNESTYPARRGGPIGGPGGGRPGPVTPVTGNVSVNDPVAHRQLSWNIGGDDQTYRSFSTAARDENRRGFDPSQRGGPTGAGGPGGAARLPQLPQSTPGDATHPAVRVESRGGQSMNGIACQETRVTTTYPIDYFGNDSPLSVVNDTCTSAELGRVVSQTIDDPRSGRNTMNITLYSVGEPNPSMFQPPIGYSEAAQPQRVSSPDGNFTAGPPRGGGGAVGGSAQPQR